MPSYATPGVYVEPPAPSRRVAAVRTDVAAFVGVAAQGPLHAATRIESWPQFVAAFGAPTPHASLAYAVKGFFENGGRTCHVVRAAAPAASALAASPQPPDGASSTLDSVAGFAAGSVVVVRRDGEAPVTRRAGAVDAVTRRVDWERPLPPALAADDPARPLVLETGARAASATLADATGAPTLRVAAASPGTWGEQLAVRPAWGARTRTHTSGAQPGDRRASLVGSAVGFAPGTLTRLRQAAPAAVEAHRVVARVDRVAALLAWDAPLPATFDLGEPIAVEAIELRLAVLLRGRLADVLGDLRLVPGAGGWRWERDPDATASQLVRIEDLEPATPFPDRLPDVAAAAPGVPLAGGGDGLAALRAEHLAGAPGADGRFGLRALERLDGPALVAVPDAHLAPRPEPLHAPVVEEPDPCALDAPPPPAPAPPPPLTERPPQLSEADSLHIQRALVEHCELRRDRVALLDPPRARSSDPGRLLRWRQRFDTSFAAAYAPWLVVLDPLAAPGETVRELPPCGHVAGLIARTDRAVGVHRAPANEALEWAHGTAGAIDAEVQGVLNPAGVNAIRDLPGRGLSVYGARTVSSDPAWRFVPVRRLLLMIEQALERALPWAVFEPHDAVLRATLRTAIASFLDDLWRRGMLAGATAEEAYFVRCDEEVNPPERVERGELLAEVGVAAVKPAEFVVFRFGRTEDELEVVEQAEVAAWR